jgi:peptidoglycan/LPS O-acetylase OafA/YrhL
VLAVFIFHLDHRWLPEGFVGVDVFFVISGYLITSIILKQCRAGTFSLWEFYQRRIARIFPAFFTVAVATLLGAAVVYTPQDLASAGANFVAAALSVANLKFMLQGDYLALSPDAQPFLHFWSLAVEEQFYLLFPWLFLLLHQRTPRHLPLVLWILTLGSLATCLIVTSARPGWAFYLLPTRAWELGAGCLVAVLAATPAEAKGRPRWRAWLPAVGLILIAVSFLIVPAGPQFHGAWAMLPVAGAVAVILPCSASSILATKGLSFRPLVLLGRMSYSLYLWHWPVFSLVDYHFYLASEPVRLLLKISLSFLAAILSFIFIENPARRFLNQRKMRGFSFACLAVAVAVCIPVGASIRKASYINAEVAGVAKGGLVFPGKPGAPSVVLMGDSYGSMYGKVVKEICAALGYKLVVISVAAGDPLPSSQGQQSQLWLDSLRVVQMEKPEFLLLGCNWISKLEDDKERLASAVKSLSPLVGELLLLNQPPVLPANANRAAIREGARPPFLEDPGINEQRQAMNAWLLTFTNGNTKVVDAASHFQSGQGEALFMDEQGRQLYQDAGHLSGHGAERIRS